MLEKDKFRFFDIDRLKETEDIHIRANNGYVLNELNKRFPDEKFFDLCITLFDKGTYGRRPNLLEKIWGSETQIDHLPKFYEISLKHSTGKHHEELIVWVPLAWNDRFAGTAGGGISTGGKSYLTYPDNTQRGWTLPFCVMNGFATATIDAGNTKGINDYTIDKKTGALNQELFDNWCFKSTHNMTVFGKAITEILHNRQIKYSYMNGGSGGGRQSLMEMQLYPDDYEGIWANCPAINWHQFILSGFWPMVVMNEKEHFLTIEKNRTFLNEVIGSYGKENYYSMSEIPTFDARTLIGRNGIDESDADVMNEIWKGPHDRTGKRLWYGYYPGVTNWQVNIPIGAYYYPLFNHHKIKPFILAIYYARWLTNNPKDKFEDISLDQLVKLFENEKLSSCFGNSTDIDGFINRGSKVMIDHGMDDPLIPTHGSIDYYQRLLDKYGKAKLDSFLRMYITPGDNHGNCYGNGPGISETEGIKALMNWVENDCAPEELRTIRVDRKTGGLIKESECRPYGR